MSGLLLPIAKWYSDRGAGPKVFASALYSFVLLWLGAVVERQVQQFTTEAGWPLKPAYFVVLFASVLILTAIHYALRLALAAAEKTNQERRETWAYAASLVEQCVAERVRRLSERVETAAKTGSGTHLFCAAFAELADLEQIVKAAYQLLESRYGESRHIFGRIEFEVTFMTRSYKDGGITIPAYANRAGRAPRSLLERSKNPSLYDHTVTALVYQDSRPRLRIVEDTAENSYAEVYPGQKERIRSSLVYPVLSHDNSLLGTLVAHCDRPRFFLTSDERFWQEIMEVFAKHLALEKTRLDRLYGSDDCSMVLGIGKQTPPF